MATPSSAAALLSAHPLHDGQNKIEKIGELPKIRREPVISMFYGVIVALYFFDTGKHNLPHIHVKYKGEEAVVGIPDGEIIEGSI